MDPRGPLTTEEAAKLLKISKYTLYELIKRGEIPAYRVGRQLRLDPAALDRYLVQDSPVPPGRSDPDPERQSQTTPFFAEGKSLRFAGSHEPGIEMAAEFLLHSAPPIHMELAFKGSMEGLIALFHGEADVAGVHLWDAYTDEYNFPFANHLLAGEAFVLVNFAKRIQGWIVSPGNPLGLTSWADITRNGLRFVNRQKGSGTRIRVDSYLHLNQIAPSSIQGYTFEETTHSGVALRIANGQADAGIGVQASAQRLGLDFVPLFQEHYDLVYLEKSSTNPALNALLHTLRLPAFQKALQQLGSDTSLSGQVLAQR